MLNVTEGPNIAELVEAQRHKGLILFIHDDEHEAMISNQPSFRLGPSHPRDTDGLTVTPNRNGITVSAMGMPATFQDGGGFMGRAHIIVHDGFFIVAMPQHTLMGVIRNDVPSAPITQVELMSLKAWWNDAGIEGNTRKRVDKLLDKLIAIHEIPQVTVTVRESTMR
jgi:hypothetical protein